MIEKEKMITTSVRIPESLFDWVKKNAEQGFRSQNGEILKQLIEAKKREDQNVSA